MLAIFLNSWKGHQYSAFLIKVPVAYRSLCDPCSDRQCTRSADWYSTSPNCFARWAAHTWTKSRRWACRGPHSPQWYLIFKFPLREPHFKERLRCQLLLPHRAPGTRLCPTLIQTHLYIWLQLMITVCMRGCPRCSNEASNGDFVAIPWEGPWSPL